MGFNRNLGNIPEVITVSGTNIGIGNQSATRKLEVASDGSNWISGTFSGTGNTNKVVIGNLTTPTIGGHNAALNAWTDFTIAGDSIIFSPFGSEKMRVNGLGNVGIGTTSPTSAGGYATLSIGGSGSTKGQITWNSGTSTIGYSYNDATNMTFGSSNDLIFATTGSATERMRITLSGNVLIGTQIDNGYKLNVNGSISSTSLSLSGNYSVDVTTNSGWSSYQNIINPGTLLQGVTYMISIRWNFSAGNNQPYYCYCSFLWVGAFCNSSGGTDNEFTPICSSHTGGGSTISFRSIAGPSTTSGIQARLNSFPTLGGVMTVKAIRLE